MLGYGIKSSPTHTGAQRQNGKWGNSNNTLTQLLPGPSPHQRLIAMSTEEQRHYSRQGNPINLDREAEPLPWLLSGLSQQSIYIDIFMFMLCMYVWAYQDLNAQPHFWLDLGHSTKAALPPFGYQNWQSLTKCTITTYSAPASWKRI